MLRVLQHTKLFFVCSVLALRLAMDL